MAAATLQLWSRRRQQFRTADFGRNRRLADAPSSARSDKDIRRRVQVGSRQAAIRQPDHSQIPRRSGGDAEIQRPQIARSRRATWIGRQATRFPPRFVLCALRGRRPSEPPREKPEPLPSAPMGTIAMRIAIGGTRPAHEIIPPVVFGRGKEIDRNAGAVSDSKRGFFCGHPPRYDHRD
jgi:hypothetical protein